MLWAELGGRIRRANGGPQTVIEYGSHDELMAQGGRYADMFTMQRKGFDGQYD